MIGRLCQKRVVALFIDKNRQTNVKTVSPHGLLLCTPISIVMTLLLLYRPDHPLKTDRQRSVKADTFPRLVVSHFDSCSEAACVVISSHSPLVRWRNHMYSPPSCTAHLIRCGFQHSFQFSEIGVWLWMIRFGKKLPQSGYDWAGLYTIGWTSEYRR
jgi:hypothetical protein